MPIYIDILENKVLGREFKKGLREGRQEGELAILRRLKAIRFATAVGRSTPGGRFHGATGGIGDACP
jgi:hypothetical protein